MTTRRLFIEETTPGATGCGIRETFEPSESEMAELGWQRIPSTIPPANGHEVCLPGALAELGPVARIIGERAVDGNVTGSVMAASNHRVVQPCPLHGDAPSTLCGKCNAWAERETSP